MNRGSGVVMQGACGDDTFLWAAKVLQGMPEASQLMELKVRLGHKAERCFPLLILATVWIERQLCLWQGVTIDTHTREHGEEVHSFFSLLQEELGNSSDIQFVY